MSVTAPSYLTTIRARHLYSASERRNLCGAAKDDLSQTKSVFEAASEENQIRCAGCVSLYQQKYNKPDFIDKVLVQTEEMLHVMLLMLSMYTFFSFDTETEGLEAWAKVVGLSILPIAPCVTHGFYVSIGHRTLFDVNIPRECIARDLKPFFEDPAKTFLGHNIGFDQRAMWRLGINLANIEDTQVAGYLVDVKAPKGLKTRAVHERLTKDTISLKSFGKKCPADIWAPEFVEYTVQDVQLPPKMYQTFIPKLKQRNLLEHYTRIELPYISVLARMEHRGIRLRPDMIHELEAISQAIKRERMEKVFEIAGESFKITSGDQLRYILYDKLKLHTDNYTDGGKKATNLKTLDQLAKQGHEIAKHLAEFSRAATFIKMFTSKLPYLVDHESRIHTSYNNVGTDSGRLSSDKPNLQNIPGDPRFRAAFVPAPGKVFVMADYGQLQLRIMAHFSQDPVMVDAFNTGKDLHSIGAAQIHRIPIDDFLAGLKAEKEHAEKLQQMGEIAPLGQFQKWRKAMKNVNFGVLFQGGAETLGVPEYFIKGWRVVHPVAANYVAAHNRTMNKHGTTQTLAGRYITDLDATYKGHDDKLKWRRAAAERSLFACHIQGSEADIMKLAMIRLDAYLETHHPGAGIVLQVHDELIVECWEHDAETIAPVMQQILESSYKLRVPLEAIPTIGRSWADKN